MWVYSIFILSVLLLVQGKSIADKHPENVTLKWPARYSFEATRICVLSGLVEDYKMWRAPNNTRVDTNRDADESFVKDSEGELTQYKIHPESDSEQDSKTKCEKVYLNEGEEIEFPKVLPDAVRDYQKNGTEVLGHVIECTVFRRMSTKENLLTENTVWAVRNNDNETWAPIKLVTKVSNIRLGTLTKYETWEFNNFTAEVDDADLELPPECLLRKHKEDTEKLLFLDPKIDSHVEIAFNAFKQEHSRNYNGKEHNMRKEIFRRNMRIISQTNQKNLGYKLAINQFADRTNTEMKKFLGFRPQHKINVGGAPFSYSKVEVKNLAKSLPRQYDARMYGLVSPVKNQQQCGSCWSFSATAVVEGAYARSTGRFVTLSNQALVDCAWPYGAYGCDGGNDDASFSWVMQQGLPTEAEYGTYKEANGYCNIKNMSKTYSINRYVSVPPYDVDALKLAIVNHGPVAVSINASSHDFKFYSSGIMHSNNCPGTHGMLDHAVPVVGYGVDHGETFWILKNSWGRQWGVDGYIYLTARNNTCGVMTGPNYVVL